MKKIKIAIEVSLVVVFLASCSGMGNVRQSREDYCNRNYGYKYGTPEMSQCVERFDRN